MEERLGIKGLDGCIRDSFLINRKPTETEIYRTKGLLKEIQEAITTIETLSRSQGYRGIKPDIRRQSEENTVRLILAYESLKKVINDNSSVADRLAFDIAGITRDSRRILEEMLSYSSNSQDLVKLNR